METSWTHPEQKKGEVFLLNVKDNEPWEEKALDWLKGIRRGKIAYSNKGKHVIENIRPLFGVPKTFEETPHQTINTGAGDHFSRVSERAQQHAKDYNCIVEFDFNGVKIEHLNMLS